MLFRALKEGSASAESLLNAVHQPVEAVPTNPGDKPPVGYICAKVYNEGVLLSALIDSGNLSPDLISKKLAKTLSLKISGKPCHCHRVGP